jgi:hypothetical protein
VLPVKRKEEIGFLLVHAVMDRFLNADMFRQEVRMIMDRWVGLTKEGRAEFKLLNSWPTVEDLNILLLKSEKLVKYFADKGIHNIVVESHTVEDNSTWDADDVIVTPGKFKNKSRYKKREKRVHD